MDDLFVKHTSGYNLRERNCLTLIWSYEEVNSYKGSVLWKNLHNETKVIENSKYFSKAITNEELIKRLNVLAETLYNLNILLIR
jgi:hypothetical protein